MKHLLLLLSLLITLASSAQKNKPSSPKAYFPPYGEWKLQDAATSFDTALLAQAIQFAKTSEVKQPRSMETSQAMTFGKEPFGEAVGPFADRGEPTGLIIHKGYIVASWGEPLKVDMTHSVTKSFLSTVVGLAVDRGLIKSADDTVAGYIPFVELFDPVNQQPTFGKPSFITPFATPHNSLLTWDVMLRQTSDWEGTLWGKADWADRPDTDATKWLNRKRNAPGSVYEYNDVRVNALALAATNVWRRPLPQVLRDMIMDPIGASNTWRWTGYRNSWIVLDGQAVQSVSGGGHWGGGMFINAYDMARFGLLTLHQGNWDGKQLISADWIKRSLTPTAPQLTYGYMNFFLNTGQKYMPSASATAFVHVGNGTNVIFVDPDHDLVMVARWFESRALDGLVKRVLAAIK